MKLKKADIGKSFKLSTGKVLKLTNYDPYASYLHFGGKIKGESHKDLVDDCYWFKTTGECNWVGQGKIISRVTRGRPKGLTKKPILSPGQIASAAFETSNVVSPPHELEYLEKAYNALMALDESARKRCLDWLVDKLKA